MTLDASLRAALNDRSVDGKLNTVLSITEQSLQFIPASKPFENETRMLKSKYIYINATATSSKLNNQIQSYSHNSKQRFNGKLSCNATNGYYVDHSSVQPTGSQVPPPQFQIYPADAIKLNWEAGLRVSTGVGLSNLGNTCFLNSILQVLVNTPPLVNYLYSDHHGKQPCPSQTGYCAICALKQHVKRVHIVAKCRQDSLSPQFIVQKLRCVMKSHSFGRQQDAHEFLRYFVDAMQNASLHMFKDKKQIWISYENGFVELIGSDSDRRTATVVFAHSHAYLESTNHASKSVHLNFENCSLKSCFNFSRCLQPFKVHIYPPEDDEIQIRKYFKTDKWRISVMYKKILRAIRESKFYTEDAQKACIFVLSFDTLDRDVLSPDYLKDLQLGIKNLPEKMWNKGLNNLVFNLYFGSWPNYEPNDFGVNFEQAILAKASFSSVEFRPMLDVSLPLFHSTFPSNADESIDFFMHNDWYSAKYRQILEDYSYKKNQSSKLPNKQNRTIFMRFNKTYLLSFKGKRYTHGIGSESRNALYHLHNGQDVIMLTSCKHGKNWEKMKDERCDRDNLEYDKWDYNELLANSAFCLIPRGRRLGSYRFLEALAAGCIPVILANDWVLPFAEVLDWNHAVVVANENAILQIPDFLRSFTNEKVSKMRQNAISLYRHYLSDVEKIVDTTFEIIKNRLDKSSSLSPMNWNALKGGVWTHLPDVYFKTNGAMRFHLYEKRPESFIPNVTAVVNIFKAFHGYFSRVKKLLKELLGSDHVTKVYVLVHFSNVNQILSKHDVEKVKVLTKRDKGQGLFYGFELEIESDAVIFIDASFPLKMSEVRRILQASPYTRTPHIYYNLQFIHLQVDHILLALKTYKKSPHRLLSFHMYDEVLEEQSQNRVLVEESETNCYSIAADLGLIVDRAADQLENGNTKLRKNPGFADLNEKKRCFDRFLSTNKHLRLASRFGHRRVCSG